MIFIRFLTTICEGNNNNNDADEGEKEKSSDYTFQIPSPLVSPLNIPLFLFNIQKEKKNYVNMITCDWNNRWSIGREKEILDFIPIKPFSVSHLNKPSLQFHWSLIFI